MNKITFHRFKKSKEKFDIKKYNEDIACVEEAKYIQEQFENYPVEFRKIITREEMNYLKKYVSLKCDFINNSKIDIRPIKREGNRSTRSFSKENRIFYSNIKSAFISGSEKISIFLQKNLYLRTSNTGNSVSSRNPLDLSIINPIFFNDKPELKIVRKFQEFLKNNEICLEKIKNIILIDKYNCLLSVVTDYNGIHDRIEINDMNDINLIIEEMNDKGWSVKQIEGIQSGKHEINYGGNRYGGSGYGFGFTEGIMIVWEKEKTN